MKQWAEEFDRELRSRLQALEDSGNRPPRFSRRDYALVIAAALLCLAGLFWGAFL